MKRFFQILLLCSGLNLSVLGQAPVIEWQKCFGGSGNERPGRNCIIQMMDSGFVIAGTTDSNDGDVSGLHGLSDYWITRLDQTGNIIWQKCYGGSIHDGAISVVETFDNGLIVCGQAGSFDGNVTGNHSIPPRYDAWVLKLDSSGNLQWQKCYGGSDDETGFNIIQTLDSGYVVAGWTTSNDGDVSGNHSIDTADVWLIKLDSAGTLQWQRCYGGTNEDKAYSVIQTLDGGFALTGYTLSNNGDVTGNHDSTGNNADLLVLKTDGTGNLQWQKCLGGSRYETGEQIIQNVIGNLLIFGSAESNDGDVSGNHAVYLYEYWIVNLDIGGNFLAQRCFGGSKSDFGYSIVKDNSGGYVLGGSTYSNDGDVTGNHGLNKLDYWLLGIDSSYNLIWQHCYGGTDNEFFSSVISTYDGGFLACGYTRSNDGDVSGHHQPLYAGDYWVVKLSAPYVGVQEPSDSFQDFSVYHDQFSHSIALSFYANGNEKVNLQLIDITGRILLQDAFSATNGLNKHQIFTGDLGGGIYFVRLQGGGGAVTKKVIVQ